MLVLFLSCSFALTTTTRSKTLCPILVAWILSGDQPTHTSKSALYDDSILPSLSLLHHRRWLSCCAPQYTHTSTTQSHPKREHTNSHLTYRTTTTKQATVSQSQYVCGVIQQGPQRYNNKNEWNELTHTDTFKYHAQTHRHILLAPSVRGEG